MEEIKGDRKKSQSEKGWPWTGKENLILRDLRKESRMGVDAGVGKKFIKYIYQERKKVEIKWVKCPTKKVG